MVAGKDVVETMYLQIILPSTSSGERATPPKKTHGLLGAPQKKQCWFWEVILAFIFPGKGLPTPKKNNGLGIPYPKKRMVLGCNYTFLRM